MDAIIESMTVPEVNRLAELEERIEAGLQTFVDVGMALAEIRDGKLYRTTHLVFRNYCRDRWGLSESHAYELMDAATVVENIKTSATAEVLPTSERQARPLAKFDPEVQREVWHRSVETAPNGRVTARHVEQTAKAYQQERTPPPAPGCPLVPEPPKEVRQESPQPVAVDTDAQKFARLGVKLHKCDAMYDEWRRTNSHERATSLREELYDTMTEYENGIFEE